MDALTQQTEDDTNRYTYSEATGLYVSLLHGSYLNFTCVADKVLTMATDRFRNSREQLRCLGY